MSILGSSISLSNVYPIYVNGTDNPMLFTGIGSWKPVGVIESYFWYNGKARVGFRENGAPQICFFDIVPSNNDGQVFVEILRSLGSGSSGQGSGNENLLGLGSNPFATGWLDSFIRGSGGVLLFLVVIYFIIKKLFK